MNEQKISDITNKKVIKDADTSNATHASDGKVKGQINGHKVDYNSSNITDQRVLNENHNNDDNILTAHHFWQVDDAVRHILYVADPQVALNLSSINRKLRNLLMQPLFRESIFQMGFRALKIKINQLDALIDPKEFNKLRQFNFLNSFEILDLSEISVNSNNINKIQNVLKLLANSKIRTLKIGDVHTAWTLSSFKNLKTLMVKWLTSSGKLCVENCKELTSVTFEKILSRAAINLLNCPKLEEVQIKILYPNVTLYPSNCPKGAFIIDKQILRI